MLRDSIPALYEKILPPEILALRPHETKATCGDCYKSKKAAPLPHYDEKLKCCTYYPFIPNYLVGAILNDPAVRGYEILRELIRERKYVLPIGLCAPVGYQNKFNAIRSEAFGRDADLLCPFFEYRTGYCGVWKYRGHECATFFCESSYGANGERFWSDIRSLLHYTEMHLSQEAMLFKGFSSREIDENLKYVRIEESANDSSILATSGAEGWSIGALRWSQLWAHHHDDIEGYFKGTFAFVEEHASLLKKQVYDEKFRTGEIDSRLLSHLIVGRPLSKDHRPG